MWRRTGGTDTTLSPPRKCSGMLGTRDDLGVTGLGRLVGPPGPWGCHGPQMKGGSSSSRSRSCRRRPHRLCANLKTGQRDCSRGPGTTPSGDPNETASRRCARLVRRRAGFRWQQHPARFRDRDQLRLDQPVLQRRRRRRRQYRPGAGCVVRRGRHGSRERRPRALFLARTVPDRRDGAGGRRLDDERADRIHRRLELLLLLVRLGVEWRAGLERCERLRDAAGVVQPRGQRPVGWLQRQPVLPLRPGLGLVRRHGSFGDVRQRRRGRRRGGRGGRERAHVCCIRGGGVFVGVARRRRS